MGNLNTALLRFSHPLAFKAFLRHMGAPVDGLYRKQGLPALCVDPSAFVSLRKAWGFFHDAALKEDQYLGWQVGQYAGDNNLSAPVLKKLENAPTLYSALHKLAQLINSEASHIKMGILERHSDILFYTHYSVESGEPGYLISQGYQLTVVIDVIRHFAGPNWSPTEIGTELSEITPTLQDQFPNSPIRVNQPFGFVSIPRACLHRKLINPHDIGVNGERLIWAEKLNYAETLELLVEPYLSDGYPNMCFAASLVDQSTRTVARRLAECGTSYQSLLDSLRFRKAKDLLKHTDMPINEVAWSVGFDDPANFGRMFRRIGGTSPLRFRRCSIGAGGSGRKR